MTETCLKSEIKPVMKEITPKELKNKLDAGEIIQIIDIRENYEVESGSLGGDHIRMAEVMDHCDKIRKDCMVVIHCKSGARASAMVYALENERGFENVYHLKGGIEAWANDIDPKIIVY